MAENCALSIQFYELSKSTLGIDPVLKDRKGSRPSRQKSIKTKYGHLVGQLGSYECQRAALRLYFNQVIYEGHDEFYEKQCALNGLSRKKIDLYNGRLTKRVNIGDQKYMRHYFWSSHRITSANFR